MGINRNIVECKEEKNLDEEQLQIVLIETLWNVKCIFNVKSDGIIRINRNIVECKDHSENSVSIYFLVLIETLWNVKIKLTHDFEICLPY